MKARINIHELEPRISETLNTMEKHLSACNIAGPIRELIKIRVSQINKCAYCIALHTSQARKAGEAEQKIYALSAWQDSPLFSPQEKSVLALTEKATLLSENEVPDELISELLKYFGDNQLAEILITIGHINFWNRICAPLQMIYDHNEHGN